jgi:hypothetical protein
VTQIRLAYGKNPRTWEAFRAYTDLRTQAMSTTVRLAYSTAGPHAFDKYTAQAAPEAMPALLVSYFYIKQFDSSRQYFDRMRDWSMDSGAFSAHNSGKAIDILQYIDTCKQRLAEDAKLTEVFSLDVIGDWRASWKATDQMWKAGVKAIPTFHYGEPWDVLKDMARSFPKISIGGVVKINVKEKLRWVEQVFSRVWPAKVHGLGIHSEQILMKVPFHSCDATNWAVGPACFGRYSAFGGDMPGIRGKDKLAAGVASEIAHFVQMERNVQSRWRKTFEDLGWR